MRRHYRNFITSLKYALNGIATAIKYEVHMRYHLCLSGCAVAAGFYFKLSEFEWLYLMLTITLVLFAELMNTAIEANVDLATKDNKPEAKIAKDVAAGAVLITSINAIVTAWILFGTKFFMIGQGI